MDTRSGRCLAALALLLFPAILAAQVADSRMPRGPGEVPAPLAQKLVIEGEWGYPCTLTIQCFPTPPQPPYWQPLEVAAWVGEEKFTGAFTGNQGLYGDFEVTIEVPPQQRGEMVLVEILVESPDGHLVRFQAIQGVAGRLLAEAGSGERLYNTGLRPNSVTVLSTALVGLLRDANAGDWRMDHDTFMDLLAHLEPARIMRHGVVLERMLRGVWPGFGDLDPNELIASADAVDAYLAALPGGPPNLRLSDSRSESPYQWPHYAALNLTLLPAAAPGTVAFGRRAGLRMRTNDAWMPEWYSLMEHGHRVSPRSMFLIGTNDNRPTTVNVVLLDEPASETGRFTYDCPGFDSVAARRTTERLRFDLWRMAVAGGLEFVEVEHVVRYTYEPLDGGVLPCAGTLPPTGVELSYHLAHRAGALGRVGVVGRRAPFAVQLLNPDPQQDEPDSEFIAGVVDLGSGAVDVPGYATQGEVGVGPDGLLALTLETLPDVQRPGVVEVRIEPMRRDGMGAEEWIVSARLGASADDHVRALVSPAVRVAPGLMFTAPMLDGGWDSGVDLSRPGAVEVGRVEFNAVTGQGVAQSPGMEDVPFSWLLEDGRMVASTYALDSAPGELLPACPAGALDCHEVYRRVWQLLRIGGHGGLRRLYLIEELWVDSDEGLQRVSRQLNFYDAS